MPEVTTDSFGSPMAFYDAREMRCPVCPASIPYYDLLHARFFGCPSCHSFFELTPDGLKPVLRRFDYQSVYKPKLEIGATGSFDGVSYVVAGFMRKEEEEGQQQYVHWDEYALYSKNAGYATLVCFDGHWMLVRPISGQPEVTHVMSNVFTTRYEETTYKLYHSYTYKFLIATGAFDENILDWEGMHTWEYVAPPKMMVSELLRGKTDWYQGAYLSRRDVGAAFGLPVSRLPYPRGVGIIQPSPYAANKRWLGFFAAAMLALTLIAVLIISALRPTVTMHQAFPLIADSAVTGSSRMIVTGPFTLDNKGGVDITLSATLNNEWLEASVTMVNDRDGSSYDFTKTLEYYSGVDGGESWTEGSQQATAYLGGIPAGQYHLNIFPYSEKPLERDLYVSVTKNPMLWSNLVILLLAVVSVPFINYQLDRNFEKRRTGDE